MRLIPCDERSVASRLKLWRKEELYPSIVKDQAEIGLMVDVCFKPQNFTAAGGIGALAQSLLILDATEEISVVEDRDGFCDALMKDVEEGRLSEALTRFGRLS